MGELLKPLAALSRQPLQVGTPPSFIFDERGCRQSAEMLQLSVQLRIAEALEAQNTVLLPQTAHIEIMARHEQAFRHFMAETAAEWETDLRVVSTKPGLHDTMVLVEVAYPLPALLFTLGKLWESRVAEGIEEEGGQADG